MDQAAAHAVVDEAPTGPGWVHEIKTTVTGCMRGSTAARSKLLTRTGPD